MIGLLTYLSTGLLHTVHGHVKWFAPYDLGQPPLRIDQVLTAQFIYFFLGSVAFIYTFFLMDRYLYRRRFLSSVVDRFVISPPLSLLILRVAAFVFFFSLFVYGLFEQPFLLTPELKVEYTFVPWLQLAIAVCAVSRYTVPLIGIGIVFLYLLSVAQYGLSHALDYFIFLGVAYYFGASRAAVSFYAPHRSP